MSAVLLPLPHPRPRPRPRPSRPRLQLTANPKPIKNFGSFDIPITRRLAILTTFTLSTTPFIHTSSSASAESFLSGISNTKSWFQFYGDGFAIRVPPQFQDIMDPEVGLLLLIFFFFLNLNCLLQTILIYFENFKHYALLAYLFFHTNDTCEFVGKRDAQFLGEVARTQTLI